MQAQYGPQWVGRRWTRIALLVSAFLASVVLFGAMTSNATAKTQVGTFLSGEKSEKEAARPHFNAESYPAYLSSASVAHRWEFGKLGALKCPVSLSGKLASSSSNLRLTPFVSYFACTESPGSMSVTVSSGGCEDTLDLLNQGPPYVADFGIDCPSGSSYQFGFGGVCTVSIPDQSGLHQVKLETTGSGSSRAVNANIEVSGLKYTITGVEFLCGNGTYENGTYAGSATLKGFNEP
jgi:hypothetical protein